MRFFEVKLVEKRRLAPSAFLFKFDRELEFEPGQFVMISSPAVPWIIPRPFSILESERGLTILFRVHGIWTERFSSIETGEVVNVLGPCGKGFRSKIRELGLDPKISRALCVAGGVGIASLFSLIVRFGTPYWALVFGGRTKEDLVLLDRISSLDIQLITTTEDGTEGIKGRVTDAMKTLELRSFDVIFACGPTPMVKAVYEIARERGVPTFLALEERMACGFGGCFSCAIRTKDGMKLCCKDGPVFFADELSW